MGSQRSIENLEEIVIYPATEEIGKEEDGFYQRLTDTFLDYFPEDSRIFLDEPGRILESAGAVFEEYRECMGAPGWKKARRCRRNATACCRRISLPMS